MDRLDYYRTIIRRIIAEQVEVQPAVGNVELVPVCDDTSMNYLVVMLGWDGDDRVDAPVIHIRLRDGKVWLEEDNTDELIVNQLIDAGIPKEEMVLAFYPASERPATEYALA